MQMITKTNSILDKCTASPSYAEDYIKDPKDPNLVNAELVFYLWFYCC